MATPKELALRPGDRVFFKAEHTRAVKESKQKPPIVASYLGRYRVKTIIDDTVALVFSAGEKEPEGVGQETVIISTHDDVIAQTAQR